MNEYTQYPYYCGDCETWHMSLFDQAEDGTIYQGDQNGNWDDIAESMPTPEECETQWKAYNAWVAKNGEDPLNQFAVEYEERVKVRWTFRLVNSILGVIVFSARPDHGKQIRTMDLRDKTPAYVLEYLDLKPDMTRPTLSGFRNVEELRATVTEQNREGMTLTTFPAGIIITDTLEYRKPRPAAVVKAELRNLARGK